MDKILEMVEELEFVKVVGCYKDNGMRLIFDDVQFKEETEEFKKMLASECTETWTNIWDYFEFGTDEEAEDYFYCWAELKTIWSR